MIIYMMRKKNLVIARKREVFLLEKHHVAREEGGSKAVFLFRFCFFCVDVTHTHRLIGVVFRLYVL